MVSDVKNVCKKTQNIIYFSFSYSAFLSMQVKTSLGGETKPNIPYPIFISV